MKQLIPSLIIACLLTCIAGPQAQTQPSLYFKRIVNNWPTS